MSAATETVHASAVAQEGRGVLIRGAPGSGKSTLAMELIALGAVLVSDDQVVLTAEPQGIRMSGSDATRGLIEARGIGILETPSIETARLAYVVDLDRAPDDRLPQFVEHRLLGHPVPVILGQGRVGLAAILRVLLAGARIIDPQTAWPR